MDLNKPTLFDKIKIGVWESCGKRDKESNKNKSDGEKDKKNIKGEREQ